MKCYYCPDEACTKIGTSKGNALKSLFGKKCWTKEEYYVCRKHFEEKTGVKNKNTVNIDGIQCKSPELEKKTKKNPDKNYEEFTKKFFVKCNACNSNNCIITLDNIYAVGSTEGKTYVGFRCVSCKTTWHNPLDVETTIEQIKKIKRSNDDGK